MLSKASRCIGCSSSVFANQLAATGAMASRAARAPPVFVMPRRNESSFIRQVMEQVRKDAEDDPELKKALDDMEKKKTRVSDTGEQLRTRAEAQEAKMRAMRQQMSNAQQRTKHLFEELRKQMPHSESTGEEGKQQSRLSQVHVPDWMKSAGESAKKVGVKALDRTTAFVNMMTKESKEATQKRQQDFQRSQEAARQAAKDEELREAAEEDPNAEPIPEHPHANALVVSDKQKSTWERFGFNTSDSGDSKFLGGFFDNPMLDRVFGETEISQSIREMKEIDPHFRLSQLVEDVEAVVAPSIITWFLEGDAEDLKLHCGEAAFAAVNASIAARKNQRLSLDPTILQGPEDLELKGAKSGGEVDSPCFIFTFSTQQINCLRNEKGEVVEGAIDDIRQVFYALAVQRHPEPNTVGLKFPWRVQEIAILGNQPCWLITPMQRTQPVLNAYVNFTPEDVNRINALARSVVTTEFPAGAPSDREVEIPCHPTSFIRPLSEMKDLADSARESLERAEARYQLLVGEIEEMAKSGTSGKEYISESRAKKLTKLLNGVADAREDFHTCLENQQKKAEKAAKARDEASQYLVKTEQLIELINTKLDSAVRRPTDINSAASL
ncbi:Mitochondrial import inner membrane translocase subunit TIM44 [Perkinsus chesapeaki]|uniref:Mitochondrial import inner membrane translocase subunit TIM44 n=1 Tax=Perkinsus chesapeaki TaxID=330153 RepID=A0A7J6MWU8_PERCH|nr:Mitochondrial import inner membrane translocase subunit TIM44 [Perkinsus chesapeaki]